MQARITWREMIKSRKAFVDLLSRNDEVVVTNDGVDLFVVKGETDYGHEIARKVVNMLGYSNNQSSISDDSHFIPDYQ